MRPSSRYLVTFLAGLVVGGAAAAGFVGWHWNRNLKNWYVAGVADQANVAREIYAGRSQQLADRIRQSLPAYVSAVERDFRGAGGRDWTYWLVKDVYQTSGTAVPEQLKPVFAALPPRPTCKEPVSKASGGAV